MKVVGKWSYIVGFVLVVVGAFTDLGETVGTVVVLLAVLAGLFWGDADELTNFGIRYLTLVVVAATIGEFFGAGTYITAIAEGLVAYFGPAILTMLLVFQFKKVYAMATEK